MQRIQPVLPSFKNMTIKTKVIAAFAAMLAVTVGLGIFADLRLAAVNDQAADIRDNWLLRTRALSELSVDTERYRIAEAIYVMSPTAELLAVAERNLRMANAVQVFKNNMIEAARLTAEQEAERQAKEKRTATLETLTTEFEAKVGQLTAALSMAATEREATAQSMSATAEQTNQQSLTVSSAAEEASANVQTVATAAEELSSSIQEIGRQVEQSARITGNAVEEAKRTDAVVQSLAAGAQKIGDVVKLIQGIDARLERDDRGRSGG
jgi:methyl-accepting chemotaxis protein